MRSRRFIVLTSLLAVTLLAWLLSYPLGTALQWSHLSWNAKAVQISYRLFQYGEGNIRLDVGSFSTRIPSIQRPQVERRFAEIFPPFRRSKPWPVSWGPGAWAIGGMGINHFDNGIQNSWQFGIPFWLPASLFLIIPLRIAFRRWVAADRRRRGLCPGCGYDLRATAGLCPECGKAAASQVLAAECGPAIVATARSSGTKAVVVLALYLAATTFLVAESFIQWQAPLLARELTVLGAMLLVLVGAFHAAGFSRSGEGLFGFGCLAGLLLLPLYVRLGNYTSPAMQVAISMGCLILMGLLARTSGVLRWRMQGNT